MGGLRCFSTWTRYSKLWRKTQEVIFFFFFFCGGGGGGGEGKYLDVKLIRFSLYRLEYRQKWNVVFTAYLKKLDATKPVILCGDLNVAHSEIGT